MIFGGRVLNPDGSLLQLATVEMVAPTRGQIAQVGAGEVTKGVLSLEAEPGPVWGLSIDGRPVIVTVVSSDGASADLGEIMLSAAGVAWPVFHAPDGQVFGLPRAARVETPAPKITAAIGDTPPTRGQVATRSSLTFGALLGSTAQQLSSAVTSGKGLQLSGANITIKGVPVATEEAIAIEFPNAELAATGIGLSEVSFTLKPRGEVEPPTAPPTGPIVPDLGGYTRELALRKLAGLGLASEVRAEIVTDNTRAGRVVRQLPGAGEPLDASTLVRIFIGKFGAE